MKIRVRKLNSNEKHACSSNDVKKVFGNDDVSIYFGTLGRDFKFDTSGYDRQKIGGTIIASASVNKRDNISFDSKYLIQFYVIKDIKYDLRSKEEFVKSYLPLIYKWYQEMLERPETALFGVEKFLVEWFQGKFKIHCYRYH